jgi:integrase
VQLSWDEGNRLGAVCFAEGSEASTAVLMCMLMGMRASEVLSRVVRDIDRGGKYLRIDDNEQLCFLTKTEKSKRTVKIQSLLQPVLAAMAAGKSPTDPLFPGTAAGRKSRQWFWEEVRRLCTKAGVPVICPHSLRGWMTSTAVAAGELPEVVAQRIGHASSRMTLAHYIAPGIAEAAELERGQADFAAGFPTPLPS